MSAGPTSSRAHYQEIVPVMHRCRQGEVDDDRSGHGVEERRAIDGVRVGSKGWLRQSTSRDQESTAFGPAPTCSVAAWGIASKSTAGMPHITLRTPTVQDPFIDGRVVDCA